MTKTVSVLSNDPQEPRITLTVKANVEAPEGDLVNPKQVAPLGLKGLGLRDQPTRKDLPRPIPNPRAKTAQGSGI